jgi:hypothetical protein
MSFYNTNTNIEINECIFFNNSASDSAGALYFDKITNLNACLYKC